MPSADFIRDYRALLTIQERTRHQWEVVQSIDRPDQGESFRAFIARRAMERQRAFALDAESIYRELALCERYPGFEQALYKHRFPGLPFVYWGAQGGIK